MSDFQFRINERFLYEYDFTDQWRHQIRLENILDLPASNSDHALSGDWAGYRECHLKPDLLLIYRKPNAEVLRLARLGSHSELFG